VANNCAGCHVASYRLSPDDKPTFVPTGPNHTFNLEAFFRFLVDCARDPRFNAGTLMNEINLAADLSWVDQMIYRLVLIPATRKQLRERGPRFAWIYNHGLPKWPDWGRGRDDAMNLTKYFLTTSPLDETLGPTDMPSIWNLKKYKTNPGTRMNFAGDSWDANTVIIDSALGLMGAGPSSNEKFLEEIRWLTKYLEEYPAPKFPAAVDEARAAAGKAVFDAQCARCHWSEKTGTVMPVREIGTDDERLKSWNKQAAWASRAGGSWRKTRPATSRPSSTASGCARLTYITDRCRPCAICSSPPRSGLECSIAATTSTTLSTSGSSRWRTRPGVSRYRGMP
jgi:cytochrome c553